MGGEQEQAKSRGPPSKTKGRAHGVRSKEVERFGIPQTCTAPGPPKCQTQTPSSQRCLDQFSLAIASTPRREFADSVSLVANTVSPPCAACPPVVFRSSR